jgi:glycogen debranching enzyme
MQEALFTELWVDDHFRTHGLTSGREWSSRSLLDLMAISLGSDLPPHVVNALAISIEAHLTDWGLATEPSDSLAYEADGYWRGPIWAPSTMLVEDGLRRAGQVKLADEISGRFLRLCEQSGFAENFDALTGEGLRDHAYTWTAATYLIFARALVHRDGTNAAQR